MIRFALAYTLAAFISEAAILVTPGSVILVVRFLRLVNKKLPLASVPWKFPTKTPPIPPPSNWIVTRVPGARVRRKLAAELPPTLPWLPPVRLPPVLLPPVLLPPVLFPRDLLPRDLLPPDLLSLLLDIWIYLLWLIYLILCEFHRKVWTNLADHMTKSSNITVSQQKKSCDNRSFGLRLNDSIH